MLRIIRVDNFIVAMGSAKIAECLIRFAKGSIQDYGYISIAYATAFTSSAQVAAAVDILHISDPPAR